MPVLEDQGLEWLNEYGDDSNIYVTGEMAQGSLGPFAGNIRGAQLASEIISNELNEDILEPIETSQDLSADGTASQIRNISWVLIII